MPKQAARLIERPDGKSPGHDRPGSEGAANSGTEAGEDLLLSKIKAPALPDWTVSRPRVEKLLAAGVRRPLTVVTGPPGAGKTILAASWLAARSEPGPAAWMSVDRYDNQPGTFWLYLAEALRRGGVPVPPPGQACVRGDSARHEFLLRLASALAGQAPPAVLVLDDIHLLTSQRTLDELAYLLRYASAGLRLVITSRMDPLLPLHRFRLTGDLAEIRAGDLAFTATEAGLLLGLHGISLSPAALAALTERNEGWAAGLRLAALSMRGHPDPDQFVKEFSAEDSAILGYLVDEVLDSEPAGARDLLMKTSILDRVSADLARELTGDGQAAGVLAAQAQANAFIQPLGHDWYRYHSLFADVLRLKLRREPRCDVGELHRRAARWFRRHGSLADAVRHAAAAGDWELAARTVVDEMGAGRLIEPRAGEPLAGTFQRMPPDPVPSQAPPLLVAAGMAVREHRAAAAASLLSVAQQRLQRLPAADEAPSRLAIAQLRLALARQAGDLALAEDSVAAAERVLRHFPADLLTRHPGVRAQVMAGRGAVEAWRGRFDSAADLLAAAAARLDDAAAADDGSARDRAGYLGQHALIEALQGRLGRAAGLAAAAATGGQPGLPPPGAAAGLALAWAHLEHDRLADSRSQLEQAEHALRARPDKLEAALAALVAARLKVASGRPRAALDLLGRAWHGWSPPSWLGRQLLLADSLARAAAGDTGEAAASARRAGTGP
ncbi:MAG TPA: AAA family ATPase, partial [Streptosporangiaceae bacterium]|nr:AAA family ATPase [Streptosporangiaceae bacterium]